MAKTLLISGDNFTTISNDAYELLFDAHFDSAYSISDELGKITVSAPGKEDIEFYGASNGVISTQLEKAIDGLSKKVADYLSDIIYAYCDHIDLIIV